METLSNCSSFLSLYVTSRLPSCWSLAPLCGFQDQATVSFNRDTCVDRRVSVFHCQEANARPPMIHGSTLEHHSDLADDTTRLSLFQKAEVVLFRQSPHFCFSFYMFSTLAFARISVGGIVIRSSTEIPAAFRPMSRFDTILARVDVCRARVGRTISSLVLVFTFALSLAFLERVNLHSVIICTRSISR